MAFLLCVSQGEKIIFEYFSDPEFIDQLMEFLSLEDRKGKDSFNPRRFCLFKVEFKLSLNRYDKNIFSFSETAYEGQPRSFPAVIHCSLSDGWHIICVKHMT